MPEWCWKLMAPATRDLEKLPEKIAVAAVETFDRIAENPYRSGKPMKFEYEGLHVARRGPYRIIYRILDDKKQINLLAVAHRSDAYRQSPS